MSVNESSATALVRFTGLGIICFNDEQQRGEIAVIRDDKHQISIRIQRPVYQDGAEKDESGNALQRETFGNVAETIGARIEAEEVSVTIRIGDREETHLLQRFEGLPFRIEIKNMDYGANAVYSDMPDYYKYLASAG